MYELPKLTPTKKLKSIAVLTSGGDAPGMNAAIRAIVRYALSNQVEVFGIMKGYSGLLEGEMEPMVASSVANIIQRGGTILKTDRCEAFLKKSVRKEAANLLKRKGIDGLVVIGGDGSFAGAHLLEKETGFPVVGIPGTIDNDIEGSDETIGFDTAVNTALDAIDRIRDTASSHDRIFLVEVMGRNSGHIALHTGVGGGAETILIPGNIVTRKSVDEITRNIERGAKRGKMSSIIVVAEGNKPGLSQKLARELDKKGYSTKVCILGHTQRGGVPSGRDRMLASMMGVTAVSALLAGKSDVMVGVQGRQIALVPLKDTFQKEKKFDRSVFAVVDALST